MCRAVSTGSIPATGKVERLGAAFDGSFDQFTLLPDGRELALGLKGTETQLYLVEGEKATKLPGLAGTYAGLESAPGSTSHPRPPLHRQ